ncbi:MAG: ABC transporter ATP-binding protein [Termitinemataceae bacterium]|nr:MAG: ABC transporter ATP-binding protein [Termitinemataceae bacterium]
MINVKNLFVTYPGSDADHTLNDVSFEAAAGEKIALLGGNGAGKSTLLLTLLGVLPIHSGEISICGIKLEKQTLSEIRRRAALVFQNPDDQLFMNTVWEDLLFGPQNYLQASIKLPNYKDEIEKTKQECETLLETLKISHLKNRMSHKLSGGEKRLAALACVLAMKPDLLLMDEPTAFLDPRGRRRLVEILQGLNAGMLIATHDIELAKELCSRVLILQDGKIKTSGNCLEIIGNSKLLEDCGL